MRKPPKAAKQQEDLCRDASPGIRDPTVGLGLQSQLMFYNPLQNTEASAGNCGSKGEVHLLGG